MTEMFLPLLAYVGAASVLTLTPGVDTAMVLRSAAARGAKAGAAASLGICGGLIVWGAGAALGLTAILAASQLAFAGLKMAGAAYLAYLGLKLICRPRATFVAANSERDGAAGAFRRGLFTNLLNPKVGVFYMTFLPQFIPAGVNVAAFSLLLALIHAALALVWFAALVALSVPLGRALKKPSVVAALDRATGCVFLAFGVKLALTER